MINHSPLTRKSIANGQQEQVADSSFARFDSAKAPVILICTSCSQRFKSNYEAQKHYMETNHHYFKLKGTTKVLSVG